MALLGVLSALSGKCPHKQHWHASTLRGLTAALSKRYSSGSDASASDQVPYYLQVAHAGGGWGPIYDRIHEVFLYVLGETYSALDLSSSHRDWKLKFAHAALHAVAGFRRYDLIHTLIEKDHSRETFSAAVQETAEVSSGLEGASVTCHAKPAKTAAFMKVMCESVSYAQLIPPQSL